MWLLPLLSLLVVKSVSSSKFSHVIIQQPDDQNSCGHNQQLLNSLINSVSQMQIDIAQLKAEGNTSIKGKGHIWLLMELHHPATYRVLLAMWDQWISQCYLPTDTSERTLTLIPAALVYLLRGRLS